MANISFDEASHLLRRAGFGGKPAEIDDLVARGREAAVDYLVDYDQVSSKQFETMLKKKANLQDRRPFSFHNMRYWWLARMVLTPRPFEEKMTLFWHNHFATSHAKTGIILAYFQNLMLRTHALARFDELLLKVAQDPAMLIWLDGITNIVGRPNENFARELQELFTMGPRDAVTGEPNYTEDDVKEVARDIFRSDEFFGERARFALVKTPACLVVGGGGALEADYEIALTSPIDYGYKLYYRRLGDMGMDLFEPPDVAGWSLNLAWINPTFLIERFNFANALITNRDTNPLVGGPFVTVGQLRRHTGPSADEKAFYDDMVAHDLAENVLLMQWSEFGRRPDENGSLGTDHGSSSTMFIIGRPVRGGLYGEQPSLEATALDEAGNPKHTLDFRAVYGTLIEKWLEFDSAALLGERFEDVGFL